MVPAGYAHIWDCCCDHGYLGESLLASAVTDTVHFVDVVPKLIHRIENTLQEAYPDKPLGWQTHCLDVAALPLEQCQGRQLIIIAGVGGDLVIQLLKAIQQSHSQRDVDYLLCPIHHQFAVRQTLIELGFGVLDEALVEEKQRYYEVMLVSLSNDNAGILSSVGDKLWQVDTAEHAKLAKTYLNKTLSHYQRIQQGGAYDVTAIISAYQAVEL